jgi:hypothetical protein
MQTRMAAIRQGALISEATTTFEPPKESRPQLQGAPPQPTRDERKGSGQPLRAAAALFREGARVTAPYGGQGGERFFGRVVGAQNGGAGWQ